MKKLLIVLFGVLAFQGYVFAESWEGRAERMAPWSSDFPDDPACGNPPVGWNADNPWVVGKGDHEAYYELANGWVTAGMGGEYIQLRVVVGNDHVEHDRVSGCRWPDRREIVCGGMV